MVPRSFLVDAFMPLLAMRTLRFRRRRLFHHILAMLAQGFGAQGVGVRHLVVRLGLGCGIVHRLFPGLDLLGQFGGSAQIRRQGENENRFTTDRRTYRPDEKSHVHVHGHDEYDGRHDGRWNDGQRQIRNDRPL